MIIFSDLDNCLLDSRYTAFELRDFVSELKENGIRISIISSKTEREILYHLDELDIEAPYGAENGCLVVVDGNRYEFGIKVDTIRKDLYELTEKTGVSIELFRNMNDKNLHKVTNLPYHLIPLAKDREFSEPFRVLSGDPARLEEELSSLGYQIRWGGKFYQLTRGCSKGRAVNLIRKHINNYAIGIGDSENDYPMLDECDYPVILNSNNNGPYRTFKGCGPEIWKSVIKKILEEISV